MVDGVLCTVSRVRLELSLVRSDLADFVSFKESAVLLHVNLDNAVYVNFDNICQLYNLKV